MRLCGVSARRERKIDSRGLALSSVTPLRLIASSSMSALVLGGGPGIPGRGHVHHLGGDLRGEFGLAPVGGGEEFAGLIGLGVCRAGGVDHALGMATKREIVLAGQAVFGGLQAHVHVATWT